MKRLQKLVFGAQLIKNQTSQPSQIYRCSYISNLSIHFLNIFAFFSFSTISFILGELFLCLSYLFFVCANSAFTTQRIAAFLRFSEGLRAARANTTALLWNSRILLLKICSSNTNIFIDFLYTYIYFQVFLHIWRAFCMPFLFVLRMCEFSFYNV